MNDSTALPSKNTESATTGMRSFRHNQDVENFFRFINDNGLRREAKMILELVLETMAPNFKKKSKKKKKNKKRLH